MKPEERWNQEQAWTNSNDGILMELWKLRGHALARYGRNRHSLRLPACRPGILPGWAAGACAALAWRGMGLVNCPVPSDPRLKWWEVAPL